MKAKLLLPGLLLFTCLAFFVVHPQDKIKQIINLKTGSTTDYEYSDDGKLSFIKIPGISQCYYEYTDKMIVKKCFDFETKKFAFDTFMLDDKGAATHIYYTEAHQGTTRTNTYDSSGFLTIYKISGAASTGTCSAVYKDGNEMSLKVNKGNSISELHYYYYADRRNTIGNENMGMRFLGVSSKNLVKEAMDIVPSKRDTSHLFYNYHFDTLGRVSTAVSYRKNKLVDSTGYSYY